MREATRVVAIVFGLQVFLLLTTVGLFTYFGGSIAHEISGQDAREYMLLGEQLLTDGSYHVPGKNVPESWRPPGYPVFVASVFALTNHSLAALLVALALIGGATSALVYLLGRALLLPQRFSEVLGILFGISPAVIWIPPSGMGGDTLFIFLFILALYLALRLTYQTRPYLMAIVIGALLGSATLVRPLGLYFSLFVLASILFLNPSFIWKKSLALITLACFGFGILTLPWMLRNHEVAGHFGLSSQFAFNPFYYNIAGFNASKNGTPLEVEQQKLMESIGAKDTYSVINGFTYYDELKSIERTFLLQNFFPYLAFHLYKMLPFFFGSGINVIYATITNEIPAFHLPFFPLASQNTSSLFYGGSYLAVAQNLLSYWPATLERLVWLTLFLLAFAAPFFTTGMQRRFALLSVLFILAVALLASPIAQPRYRIPAEPFIWLSAALTLYNFLIPYFSRKRANEPT